MNLDERESHLRAGMYWRYPPHCPEGATSTSINKVRSQGLNTPSASQQYQAISDFEGLLC